MYRIAKSGIVTTLGLSKKSQSGLEDSSPREDMETRPIISVVTIPDFAIRYVSQYLGHDAIRIAILVYRVSQCLDLQFVYDGIAIYRPRYTLPNHHNRCRMCWSLAVA